MNKLLSLFIALTAWPLVAESVPATNTPRIAIIKADDLRGPSPEWDRFIALAREKHIKVSIGVIGNSLERDPDGSSARWISNLAKAGDVEFWHHGWDHGKNETNGITVYEFSHSGLPYQREHLEKTLDILKQKYGVELTTFGAPYNAMDADTATALNDIPAITGVFGYPGQSDLTSDLHGKVLMPMTLRGEADGTGKPVFEKFQKAYADKADHLHFAAIQFHPRNFSDQELIEFGQIIDFLQAEGWIFVLPSEYIQSRISAP